MESRVTTKGVLEFVAVRGSGMFKNGTLIGDGFIADNNRKVIHSGTFANGKLVGSGKYIEWMDDQAVYVDGEFANGLLEGKAVRYIAGPGTPYYSDAKDQTVLHQKCIDVVKYTEEYKAGVCTTSTAGGSFVLQCTMVDHDMLYVGIGNTRPDVVVEVLNKEGRPVKNAMLFLYLGQ